MQPPATGWAAVPMPLRVSISRSVAPRARVDRRGAAHVEPVRLETERAAELVASDRDRAGSARDLQRGDPSTPLAEAVARQHRETDERSDCRVLRRHGAAEEGDRPRIRRVQHRVVALVDHRGERHEVAGALPGPAPGRRREHRQRDRTVGGADPAYGAGRRHHGRVGGRVFDLLVRTTHAGAAGGAEVVLTGEVARAGVGVPVLGEPEAARGDGLRLQGLRPPAASGSGPRGGHLLGDDRSEVLLHGHLVHRAVLAHRAVDRTDGASIGANGATGLAHRGEVRIVGGERRVDQRTDGDLACHGGRHERPSSGHRIAVGRRAHLAVGSRPHRIGRGSDLAGDHRLPRATGHAVDDESSAAADDCGLGVVEVHQPDGDRALRWHRARNRAPVVVIEDLCRGPAVVHGVSVRAPLAEPVAVPIAVTVECEHDVGDRRRPGSDEVGNVGRNDE